MHNKRLYVLALLGLLLALSLVGGAAAQGELPTPRADGSVVHIVQPGDTLWAIAAKYAQQIGKTPEDALPYLLELNNNPTFLNVGDEIIIIPAGQAAAPTETPPAGTPAAEATPAAEGTAPAAATVDPALGTPAAEATVAVEPTVAAEPAAEPTQTLAGSICVAAFDDINADGVRDETEELIPNTAIAIARGANTVSTYITDGMSEPYCFDLNEADTYQLQVFPPAGYTATTESSWAVAVANGEAYTVSFGLQQGTAEAASGDQTAATPAATEQAATSDSGLFSNLGVVVLGAAGFLILLAIIGIILLRRG